MIPTIPIIVLFPVLHFVWDFVLQSDQMAKGKSISVRWLSYHCAVYSTWALFTGDMGFFCAVFGAHFATDYVTSKITSRLWAGCRVHYFFVTIGADQLIHLLTTFWLLHVFGFALISWGGK